MKVPTVFLVLLLILFEVQTKKLDSGANADNKSTSSSISTSSTAKTSQVPSQAKKKRYATREVILYLTPSQIKALEEGEGLVSLQTLPEHTQPTIQDLKLQEQTEFVKQEFENLKSASIQQVERPVKENIQLASQEPILQNTLLVTNHQPELIDQEEQLKFLNYNHELNKAQQFKLQQEVNGERNAWLGYNPNIQISEENHAQEPQEDDHIVGKNKFILKTLPSLHSYDQNSENILSQHPKQLLQLQYSPRYNDQQRAIEIAQIVKTLRHHELEKQVEKTHTAPVIFVHDHVKITKENAIPLVKHVPVPAPLWVSVPEPIPVPGTLPHQYPILQQIIKHIPVPIEQRESEEIERPVQLNVGHRTSAPFGKIVFLNVGTPHVDQKIVPVEMKPWN